MIEVIALGSALGSAVIAAGTATWIARARRRPLAARLQQVEEELDRERAASRRRAAEQSRTHEVTRLRLERALGLPMLGANDEPVRGRRLASRLQERLGGIATVDRIVVGDDRGWSWTPEGDAQDVALASCCAAVLHASLRQQLPREVHLELTDARHVVVRPIPGTSPPLAIAIASTSRPASGLAVDAVMAYAATLLGTEVEIPGSDPLTGFALEEARGDTATAPLVRELASEAEVGGLGLLAVGSGDDIVGASATDGPAPDTLATCQRTLRALLDQLGHRMSGRARRVDWVSTSGSTASAVAIGSSGKSHVIAVKRQGRAEVGSFDRIAGRLRRLLPGSGGSSRTSGAEASRA